MLSVSNLLCDHQAGNEKLRYGHRHENTTGDGAPRPVVVWAVTKACNLRCVHCYASAQPGPAPGELTHDEGKALLDDLRAFTCPLSCSAAGSPWPVPTRPNSLLTPSRSG